MRSTEIHGGTLNRLDLSCRNVELVAGCEVVGIHIQYHVVGSILEVAVQIVIVVVGLVDNGLLVGSSLPGHIQRVVRCHLIGSNGRHLSGESVLTVFSYDGQLQDGVANQLGIVHLIHPACGTTTMKTVLSVVLLQLIGRIAQDELSLGNTVGIATYAGTVV